MQRLRFALLACLAGTALTFAFWLPLWQGGGFVGGDVYSYFFPQKAFFAERLQAGEFPLWNNRTGFGYPLVGESQTGVFYPWNVLLYGLLTVNSAYSASHLLHYILAFLFTALYAREFGLGRRAALFAGLVYVYGWFPSRNCVEWAIVGGAWLPACLWCVERSLATRYWRYPILLSVVLAMQLLAGHFEIAFITQLLLVIYIPARLWWTGPTCDDVVTVDEPGVDTAETPSRGLQSIILAGAIGVGFAIAAVQLLPTWELKRLSQRDTAGQHHELEFGSIPPWYWSQAIRPWHWYSPLVDRNAALQADPPFRNARTNQAEAHLYFGLIPFALALVACGYSLRRRHRPTLLWLLLGLAALIYTTGWMLPVTEHLPGFRFFQGPGRFGIVTTLAVAILAATTLDRILSASMLSKRSAGLLTAITLVSLMSTQSLGEDVAYVSRELGTRFPLTVGREGLDPALLTGWTIAGLVSIVVGSMLCVSAREGNSWKSRAGRVCLWSTIVLVTISDLWIVSRLVTFTPMVSDPPLAHLSDSPVRRTLEESPELVRLFAPGANFPNVLGVSSLPVYLTFGPAAYVDPELSMPEPSGHAGAAQALSDVQAAWLNMAGVTHILSFDPYNNVRGNLDLIWQGDDPVLNRAWARSGQPLYLYRMRHVEGRVRWRRIGAPSPTWSDPPVVSPSGFATGQSTIHRDLIQRDDVSLRIVEYRANRVVVSCEASTAGQVLLFDLNFPGWQVTIDGVPAQSLTALGVFRAVEIPAGAHTLVWNYSPRVLYGGAYISVFACLLLAIIGHLRFWHPALLKGLAMRVTRRS